MEACERNSLLSSLESAKHCIALCQHHLCCFQSETESCALSECESYEPCRVLVSNQELPVTDKGIEELCSEAYIESDGPENCLLECEEHMCCLADSRLQSSCFHDEDGEVSVICSEEFPGECSVLRPETPPPMDESQLKQMVKAHCTDQNLAIDKGTCSFYCSYRECCITEGAGNCLQTVSQYRRSDFRCYIDTILC